MKFILSNTVKRTLKGFAMASMISMLCLVTNKSLAQQHPIFTQYMFNALVVNPAYSGSHESLTLTGSMRRQWSGINGAPQTEVFSLHSPLGFSRSAAGAVAIHDQVGVAHQYMFYGTYAYRIPVSKKAKLAVGGQAGFTYYRANYNDLTVITPSNQPDAAFAMNDARMLPNVGIGIYYYSKRNYLGLSLPTLINNKWNNQDPHVKATQERHYFLTAGHVFDLTPALQLKPNVLLKWVEGGPFQYDINANLFIQKKVWVGVSYRMNDSVDGLIELIINDQLSAGYSYGYPISAIQSIQSGTHELVINYRIKRNKNVVYSPRYF